MYISRLLSPEQQRREFMQAAPPGLPLVSGIWRLVKGAVDADLFERRHVGFAGGTVFTAAVADEHDLDLLRECGHVSDVVGGDAAATENADMGKGIQVLKGNGTGLHTAHREPSQ